LGLKDEYDSYCLDDAVAWLGSQIEFELDTVHGKTPQETRVLRDRLLERLLGGGKPKFADPVATGEVTNVDPV